MSSKRIKLLVNQRDIYLKHHENGLLQSKELYSIANAIKAIGEKIEILTDEDKKALQWANNFIKEY